MRDPAERENELTRSLHRVSLPARQHRPFTQVCVTRAAKLVLAVAVLAGAPNYASTDAAMMELVERQFAEILAIGCDNELQINGVKDDDVIPYIENLNCIP